jgi:hypothetical protein
MDDNTFIINNQLCLYGMPFLFARIGCLMPFVVYRP